VQLTPPELMLMVTTGVLMARPLPSSVACELPDCSVMTLSLPFSAPGLSRTAG
jgi:hypothetical protein